MTRFSRGTALAAFALLAGAAQAQSSVTLYGLVDVGAGRFDRFSFDDPEVFKKVYKVEPGMMSTSYIGFRGTEDLGGGLKANFRLETFLRADSGQSTRFVNDTFWARAASVGLSGDGWGAFSVGRTTAPLFVPVILFNPFGDSYVWSPSVLQIYNLSAGGQIRGDSGWSNSVQYNSPKWGGFSFNLVGSAGEGFSGTTPGTGKNLGANVFYFGGPLSLTAGFQTVEQGDTGGEKQKTWLLGASYDFTFVKLFAQAAHIDDEDVSDSKAKFWALGATVPIGPGALKLAYAQTKVDGPTSSPKRKTGTLGYTYDLSKRTDITAAVMHDKQQAGEILQFGAGGFGLNPIEEGKGTSFGVNIRHSF